MFRRLAECVGRVSPPCPSPGAQLGATLAPRQLWAGGSGGSAPSLNSHPTGHSAPAPAEEAARRTQTPAPTARGGFLGVRGAGGWRPSHQQPAGLSPTPREAPLGGPHFCLKIERQKRNTER